MKKMIIFMILLIMLIPFYVNAETCDSNKIKIDSIRLEEKSSNVEELDDASADGTEINVNLSMGTVGDSIKYRIVFKNDSSDDYKLDKKSFNISSDYIDYVLETDDNSKIVKANSSKTVYLRIEYKNKVPEDQFDNGVFNDNEEMTLQLSNGDASNNSNIITNPYTGYLYFIVAVNVLLLIGVILFAVLRKKQPKNLMIFLIALSIIIPFSVSAICNYEIKIDSNIVIRDERNLFWLDCVDVYKIPYQFGMTFEDFHDSDFFTNAPVGFKDGFDNWFNSNTKILRTLPRENYTCDDNAPFDEFWSCRERLQYSLPDDPETWAHHDSVLQDENKVIYYSSYGCPN